jgi:hypothetical protein
MSDSRARRKAGPFLRGDIYKAMQKESQRSCRSCLGGSGGVDLPTTTFFPGRRLGSLLVPLRKP